MPLGTEVGEPVIIMQLQSVTAFQTPFSPLKQMLFPHPPFYR